ncbi:5-(carboxyamino)imidazole ribonucleotide synthase [Xanthomonadaceae bacterium XH05]|nr:5-(carboxyamino)imidazole ribonucleotide synthase [Xanthomonadaceae bacterium XH05]
MSAAASGPVIGILGGGQLARMMALAGLPMGLRFRVFDPHPDACAGEVVPLTLGRFDDAVALERFADGLSLATFDFENVPADSVRVLSACVPVHPGSAALATAQDRLVEKTCFNALGIPTPGFVAVADRAGLDTALAVLGAPAILKTRRFGYDGKGQFRIRSAGDADAAWAALGAQATTAGLILEAFVPFQRELSAVAVRGRDGSFSSWPVTQNWHVDGVLSISLAPARVAREVEQQAIAHVRALAEHLDYVGVFALELFEVDGRLLANEMAPRVHNSGHWTIEGAETSQFENHLRAVLGWPLGSTAARGHACMLNFVGAMPDVRALLQVPGAHWHDYGKAARTGRKVGHATLRADDPALLAERLERAASVLGHGVQVTRVVAQLHGNP